MKDDKDSAAGKERGERSGAVVDERLSRRRYEKELARLHIELVRLQEWAVRTGPKICVVFEGSDGAGKGGTSRRSLSE